MTLSAQPATVLLVHGLCSTPAELLPVHVALRQAGHEVQALTLPGYTFAVGAARQVASPYADWWSGVAQAARLAREARQRAGQPPGPVVLVGLSAGAGVALGACMLAPESVDGLVLMSTVLRTDGWAIPWYQFLLPLALYTPLGRLWQYRERPPYGVKNERVRSWVAHEMAQRQLSSAGASSLGVDFLREHDRMRRHLRRSLGRMQAPHVLALHAREDEVASLANVERLRKQLRARSFREVLLKDSYHMVTIDNDRPQVVRETLHFVNSLQFQDIPSPSTASP